MQRKFHITVDRRQLTQEDIDSVDIVVKYHANVDGNKEYITIRRTVDLFNKVDTDSIDIRGIVEHRLFCDVDVEFGDYIFKHTDIYIVEDRELHVLIIDGVVCPVVLIIDGVVCPVVRINCRPVADHIGTARPVRCSLS